MLPSRGLKIQKHKPSDAKDLKDCDFSYHCTLYQYEGEQFACLQKDLAHNFLIFGPTVLHA